MKKKIFIGIGFVIMFVMLVNIFQFIISDDQFVLLHSYNDMGNR